MHVVSEEAIEPLNHYTSKKCPAAVSKQSAKGESAKAHCKLHSG